MQEFNPDRAKRWKTHGFVGGLIGGLTILFMYFIVFDLDDPARFMKVTASQHPIELPLYHLLLGLGAALIYFGLVWVFTRRH